MANEIIDCSTNQAAVYSIAVVPHPILGEIATNISLGYYPDSRIPMQIFPSELTPGRKNKNVNSHIIDRTVSIKKIGLTSSYSTVPTYSSNRLTDESIGNLTNQTTDSDIQPFATYINQQAAFGTISIELWTKLAKQKKQLIQTTTHFHLDIKPPLSQSFKEITDEFSAKLGEEQTLLFIAELAANNFIPLLYLSPTTGATLRYKGTEACHILPQPLKDNQILINPLIFGTSIAQPNNSWSSDGGSPYQLIVNQEGRGSFKFIFASTTIANTDEGPTIILVEDYFDRSEFEILGYKADNIRYLVAGINFSTLIFEDIREKIKSNIKLNRFDPKHYHDIIHPTLEVVESLDH